DLQNRKPRTIYDHINVALTSFGSNTPFVIDASVHFPGQGAQEIRLQGKGGTFCPNQTGDDSLPWQPGSEGRRNRRFSEVSSDLICRTASRELYTTTLTLLLPVLVQTRRSLSTLRSTFPGRGRRRFACRARGGPFVQIKPATTPFHGSLDLKGVGIADFQKFLQI